MISDFKDLVKNLPNKPGVYRFYSLDNSLLYVGKAKNLKNRVSSYFQEGRPKNQRLTLMISQIERVEYTVVASEKESLILESNLIHELQPKYNILLKDDKSYIYVRITNGDQIPGIFLIRKKYDPKSDYFGPYTKKVGISDTLRTLRTIFPYCQERFPQGRACSYVGIKQCDGICIGRETKEDYLKKLDQIKKVLTGKSSEAEEFIKNKINQAVEIENYELAALWRDRLETLKETIVDQKIILPHPEDLDIVTLLISETGEGLQIGSVFVQNIRGGKVVNINNFILSGSEEIETENFAGTVNLESKVENGAVLGNQKQLAINFLQRFFSSFYSQKTDSPEVLVSVHSLIS